MLLNLKKYERYVEAVNFSLSVPFTVQTADNSHCSVSPASAFAIATAAAGHGSPPGERNMLQKQRHSKRKPRSEEANISQELAYLNPK